MVQAAKRIGTGLATTGLICAGVCIWVMFGLWPEDVAYYILSSLNINDLSINLNFHALF